MENKSKYPHLLKTEEFYKRIETLRENTDKKYALLTLDCDSFNYVNDLFGYDVGDKVLEALTCYFDRILCEDEIFVNIHADHFVFWLVSENDGYFKRFSAFCDVKSVLSEILPAHYSLELSAGFVQAEDSEESMASLLDKCNFARKEAKKLPNSSCFVYNEKMADELKWRKYVTIMMQSSLKQGEFEMYLQPKILMKTGRIVGAEALVRWNNKKYGMIYPDRFIPIFEQNGFIKEIDFYMLEKACDFINKLIANGLRPIPISVNFSKIHLRSEDFIERVKRTVEQKGVSNSLLELEMTESVFTEGFQEMVETAAEFKKLGFLVSLDDFGSAYSSLNYLRTLPFDIIKIDKGFLDKEHDDEKSRVIIAKMVELIKSLRMVAVMEGVETGEQAEFLQRLGCDLGQGYYYARPMPAIEFFDFVQSTSSDDGFEEIVLRRGETDSDLYASVVPQEFQLDNWELYTLNSNLDMGMMKGYLDGDATVQYVNDVALKYLGYTREEFRDILHNSIVAFSHPNDRKTVLENLRKLSEKGKSIMFKTRAMRKDGKIITLQGNAACVLDAKGRPIGIYAFQDVTEEEERTEQLRLSLEEKIKELETTLAAQRENEEKLRISEERYELIVNQSDDIMFEWDFAGDSIELSDKYEKLFGKLPVTDRVSTNSAIRQHVHPEDICAFEQWISSTYMQAGCSVAEFRLCTNEGIYIWLRSRSTAICGDNGTPLKAVGVFSNIDEQKKAFDNLTMKSQLDPLTHLFNKAEIHRRVEESIKLEPDQFSAFFIIDIDNFKGVNDNLGHQFGDEVIRETARDVSALFKNTDVVGRLGGDEIAVFMRNISSKKEATDVAEKIVAALKKTYYGASTKYDVSVSVGVAFYPEHGKTYSELYKLADTAFYAAKNNGKNCYAVYRLGMTERDLANTPMEPDRFLSSYFVNDFFYNIFELLYETKEVETTMQKVLELVGKKFSVDRVYIFENTLDGKYTDNTFEWCAPGITAEKGNLQRMSVDMLSLFLSRFGKEGISSCSDINELDEYSRNVLYAQGVKSFLQCAITDRGEKTGFIGFDVCGVMRHWKGEEIAIIGYLSRIISIFLLNRQKVKAITQSYNNYVEMLDNLNGFVYVIDSDNYKMLYVNNAAKAEGLKVGEICYEQCFGINKPCVDCPVHKMKDVGVKYSSSEIYSKLIKGWVLSTASTLNWEGDVNAALVCCTDISKLKN